MHSIISIPKAAMYHMFYTAAERLISLRDKIYHACDIVKARKTWTALYHPSKEIVSLK